MAENNMFELKIISPEEMFYEGGSKLFGIHICGRRYGSLQEPYPADDNSGALCDEDTQGHRDEKSNCVWWLCGNPAGEDHRCLPKVCSGLKRCLFNYGHLFSC